MRLEQEEQIWLSLEQEEQVWMPLKQVEQVWLRLEQISGGQPPAAACAAQSRADSLTQLAGPGPVLFCS